MVARFHCLIALFILLFSSSLYADMQSSSDVMMVVGRKFDDGAKPIVVVSNNHSDSWFMPDISEMNKWRASTNVSCSGQGSKAICVLASADVIKKNELPSVLVSHANGYSFDKKFINGIPQRDMRIKEVGCFDDSQNTSLCLAVGEHFDQEAYSALGFLAMSKDSGNTWNAQAISNLPPNIPIYSLDHIACTGKAADSVCLVTGWDKRGYPAAITSRNGGATWDYHFVSSDVDVMNDSFYSKTNTSCTGNGDSALCVMAYSATDGMYVSAFVSHDSGTTWIKKNISDSATGLNRFNLRSTSCASNGSHPICVSVGDAEPNPMTVTWKNVSFLFVSQDAGNTWALKPSIDSGMLHSVSCVDHKDHAVCMAVGSARKLDENGLPHERPKILVSADAGSTWILKSIPDYVEGMLLKVDCKDEGNHAICIVQGNEINGSSISPFLAVTSDNGNSWQKKSIQQLPSNLLGELGNSSYL